jgi:hypothetical protein
MRRGIFAIGQEMTRSIVPEFTASGRGGLYFEHGARVPGERMDESETGRRDSVTRITPAEMGVMSSPQGWWTLLNLERYSDSRYN